MAQSIQELEAGREALRRFAWSDAYSRLQPLAASELLTPEDLEGLAEAAWWHAELEVCVDARERAYSKYLEHGDRRRAGLVAVNVAKDHFGIGRSTIGNAWLKRAQDLLEGEEGSVELGHLYRIRAVIEYEGRGNFDRAVELAELAYAIGERVQDKDLMALALHDKGRALVAAGSVAEGMALMDEALVAAVSGELLPLTTGFIYCNMVTLCEDLADMARAAEWTDAAKRWCDRLAIAGFPGMCRVHRSTIIRRRGKWEEAAEEATKAVVELKSFNQSYTGEAFYSLGEIRFLNGDIAGADDAFRHAHSLGRDPQPGLSLLQLATGRSGSARTGITRALEEEHRELHRAKLLPSAVEIFIATGDHEAAREAADELAAIAATYGTAALKAEERMARGRVELAAGDPLTAAGILRSALKLWRSLDAPYEVATTHVLLARAYTIQGDEEGAALERRSARTIFERLGAQRDLAALDDGPVAAPPPIERPTEEICAFIREGEYWSITYGGKTFKLKDSKGLHYIHSLLRAPGSELHVLDLVGRDPAATVAEKRGETRSANEDAGAVLDQAAKAAFRQRLSDLQDDLAEAESWGDSGRVEKVRAEIDFLTAELAAAVGLSGRDRKAVSVAEKARVNVTRTLKAALERVEEHNSELGEHLRKTIRTGTFCSYQPDPRSPARWDL